MWVTLHTNDFVSTEECQGPLIELTWNDPAALLINLMMILNWTLAVDQNVSKECEIFFLRSVLCNCSLHKCHLCFILSTAMTFVLFKGGLSSKIRFGDCVCVCY